MVIKCCLIGVHGVSEKRKKKADIHMFVLLPIVSSR